MGLYTFKRLFGFVDRRSVSKVRFKEAVFLAKGPTKSVVAIYNPDMRPDANKAVVPRTRVIPADARYVCHYANVRFGFSWQRLPLFIMTRYYSTGKHDMLSFKI